MTTAILAIIMFVILIFPHELGHFIAAKAVGVRVNEFAFGMGPIIFKKQGEETLYSIRAIPVGGFCAMEGEDEESESGRALGNKKTWEKILILVSGVLMNLLIAIVIMIGISAYMGVTTNVIEQVAEGSPAMEYGIKSGDKIKSINGNYTSSWSDILENIKEGENQIEVERNGERKFLFVPTVKGVDGRDVIGIRPTRNHNFFLAIKEGTNMVITMTGQMYKGLYQLFTGQVSANDVSGPVGIISAVNATAKQGWFAYAILLALMSMNLAIFNLLPIPGLDGGRMVIVIVKKIVGDRFTDRLEGYINMGGFIFIIGLIILVTFNDIRKLIF